MQIAKTYFNIEALVLAGGENSRFEGKVKAKIEIDGKPMIGNTLELLEGIFDKVTIATNTKELFAEYDRFEMVADIYKKVGPLGGIHAAMKRSEYDAIFIVAGDMPNLSARTIRLIVDKYYDCKCEALIPRMEDKIEPLHAIYNRGIFKRLDEFLSTTDRYAIRDFLSLVDVRYLDLDGENLNKKDFMNINTPEDLKRMKSNQSL